MFASRICNSINEGAVLAAYVGMELDEFKDLCTQAYFIQKDILNVVPDPVEEAPKKPEVVLKIGQVYEVSDYGIDKNTPGKCVITAFVKTGGYDNVRMRWIIGKYAHSNENNGFDQTSESFFDREEVKLVSEKPEPAAGQIWTFSLDTVRYYLLVKRTDHTSPWNTGGDGWEVKVSDDLDTKFRWLNDWNWRVENNIDLMNFIGYKDDKNLDRIEGIN